MNMWELTHHNRHTEKHDPSQYDDDKYAQRLLRKRE
jgi:hypothetical protein